MNGLAAVLVVSLSMPGIPHKEFRELQPSYAVCRASLDSIKTEIAMYAALEGVPKELVKFKAECKQSIAVSDE